MSLAAGIAAGGAVCPAAEVLDRVAASIGAQAITASDVEREYQLERFLDGQWPAPPPSTAALASAREHLTYQVLLAQVENPGPAEKAESEKAATQRLAMLHKEYAQAEDFPRALQELDMTEAEVLARIAQQELMLRLIDQRLRPAASPTDEEVADYYRSTFVPEFSSKNGGAAPPPISQVDAQIREVLTQKHINDLLDQWIEELKPTADVRFHSF